jgi:glycolate oxidase iron-sulfur subunit
MGLKVSSSRSRGVPSDNIRSAVSEQVILFTGCTSSLIDPNLARDAEQLLTTLGYEVIRSEPGACCGALNRHAGNRQVADQQRSENTGLFQRYPGVPVISLATGCSAEIQDYQEPVPARHQEITAFLLGAMTGRAFELGTDGLRVAIHTPCTQRNVLKQEGISRRLLALIPGLDLLDMPLEYGCCGAGGLNQIEQEDIGAALLGPILDWLKREQPDVIVCPNAGCSLHLQAGMKQLGISCELTHPVQLLASLMKSA